MQKLKVAVRNIVLFAVTYAVILLGVAAFLLAQPAFAQQTPPADAGCDVFTQECPVTHGPFMRVQPPVCVPQESMATAMRNTKYKIKYLGPELPTGAQRIVFVHATGNEFWVENLPDGRSCLHAFGDPNFRAGNNNGVTQ